MPLMAFLEPRKWVKPRLRANQFKEPVGTEMHRDIMEDGSAYDNRRVGIQKQARVRVFFAVFPNVLGNQFHFGFQNGIDVVCPMVRVIWKERKLIICQDFSCAVGKAPDGGLEVGMLERHGADFVDELRTATRYLFLFRLHDAG